MSTVVDAAMRRRPRHGREGAALPIVLGILAVLLVIVAWFYTNTQLHLRQATNVINQTRAELIADGGVAVAVAFLNQDHILHPTVTSLDHAWRVYFNGAWAAGKPDFWRDARGLQFGGLPEVKFEDIETAVNAGIEEAVDARLAGDPPGQLDPFDRLAAIDAADRGLYAAEAVHAFLPWMYVPRRIDSLQAFATAKAGVVSGDYPFVLSPDLDETGQLPSEQIAAFTDVDNTGDGLNDSIWLPVPRERDVSDDWLDNDLNGEIDEDGELGLFVYWGGDDGLDNDGDGEVDGDTEQRPFFTMPLDIYYPDPDLLIIVKDTTFGADASIIVRRSDPDAEQVAQYTMYLKRPAFDVLWPDGGYDAIDNDYSLIVNEGSQTRYWDRLKVDGFYVSKEAKRTGLIPPALYQPDFESAADYEMLHTQLSTLHQIHGAAWIYGEPVCELAGRMAVHVTDEASKANMNVAGARFFDSLGGSDTPMVPAINQGLAPHEYDLRTLPDVGLALGDRLWNFRMGAPGGNGFSSGYLFDNRATPGTNPLDYDISLPGYGRIDDDGSLLYMLLNGLDDDGDGFLDSGLEPINGVYPAFEGIDDPFEYRLLDPLRNRIAEANGANDDADESDAVTDEIGELADRAYRSIEQMRLLDHPTIENDYKYLRNFLTPHSSDKNLRFRHSYGGGTRLALRARDITGAKLDYNYAPADDIYRMLKEDWGYENQYLDVPDPYNPDLFAHLWDTGLVSTGGTSYDTVAVPSGDGTVPEGLAGAFGLGLRLPDLTYRTLGGATLAGSFGGQQADPELRAMQLAVNTRDFADPDHARSEFTTSTRDLWWDTIGFPGLGQEVVERKINYTRAGVENIRINEIMVRPVRRVEAETVMDPTLTPNFSPNHFSPLWETEGIHDFWSELPSYVTQALWQMPTGNIGPRSAFSTVETETLTDIGGVQTTVPNLIQFKFAPSPGLPPGLYYLMINTRPEGDTDSLVTADDLKVVVKYGIDDAGVIEDLRASVLAPDALPTAIIGAGIENTFFITPPGTVPYDYALVPDGVIDTWYGGFPQDYTSFVGLGDEPGWYTPSATVRIPERSANPAEQVYLYVAVWTNGPPLSVNFFDFSQEPDHEWIELVNTAPLELVPGRTEEELAVEQAVDLSGWDLKVEHGHPVTGEGHPLVMTIPENTFIAPGGSLLLAVNKFDYAFGGVQPVTQSLQGADVYANGIGLAKSWTGADPQLLHLEHVTVPPLQQAYQVFMGTGILGRTVFDPQAPVDYVDFSGDSVADTDSAEQWVTSSIDVGEEAQPFITDGVLDPNRPWDRIVQLEIPGLEGDVAEWVLAGGVFPNYPEYDGIDNDGDNQTLMTDGVDNDGDGNVDEPWELAPDPTTFEEGIDEGRFRRENPWSVTESAVPGAYAYESVAYHMAVPRTNGNPNEVSYIPGVSAVYPPYLGVTSDPADWKAFVERRFYPGDCVVVTLYEGPEFRGKIADRITYTQQDVVNRAMDDIRSIRDVAPALFMEASNPERALTPSLYLYPMNPNYPTTWPDNTMAVDFYRSLERWHPLYPGDRLGTSNRWEATDGNYDDWAPSTSAWERVMTADGTFTYLPRVIDERFNHAFSGSPLRMNLSQRVLEGALISETMEEPFQEPFWDYGLTDVRYYLNEIVPALAVSGVADATVTSPGDLLTVPLFYREMPLRPAPINAGGSHALQGSQILSESFATGAGEPTALQDLTVKGILAGQPRLTPGEMLLLNEPLAYLDPTGWQTFAQDRHALVGSGGVTASLSLTAAQADMAPLAPLFGDVSGVNPATLYAWAADGSPPPAWTPVVAFAVPGEIQPEIVDPTDAIDFIPLPLFEWNALRDPSVSAVFPAALSDDDILARWPLTALVSHPYTLNVPRAVMYVSGSTGDFFQVGLWPEALFLWNEEDGLANGEYDVYVQTASSLEALRGHGLLSTEAQESLFGALPARADENLREMKVDLTFYSDRNDNNTFGIERGPDPQSGALVNTVADAAQDSFGDVRNVYPGADGVIPYGLVRVSNNYLAMKLTNRAPAGRVNRFVRVILAPHNRTAGRININTTDTQLVGRVPDSLPDARPVFNGLYGIPGVLLDGNLDYPDNPAPPTAVNYRSGIYTVENAFAWRSLLIHAGRTEHLDGRYYELPSDLFGVGVVLDEMERDALTGRTVAMTGATDLLRERILRYRRMANLITTRSDVFEIRVTAQAGYGVDGNYDGYIDYRSDTEFFPTGEARVRTVYER